MFPPGGNCCGATTVMAPFLNFWCGPLMLTNSKPSALSRLMMARLLRTMRKYMHMAGNAATSAAIPVSARERPYRGGILV